MKLVKTELQDAYIIEPQVIGDNRGWFMETYNKLKLTNWGEFKIKNNLKELGIDNSIIIKYSHLFNEELQKEKIKKIIAKNIKSNHKENSNLKNKIYTNLMNLGYSKDLIINELNNNF